jgi:hypothetical protein
MGFCPQSWPKTDAKSFHTHLEISGYKEMPQLMNEDQKTQA